MHQKDLHGLHPPFHLAHTTQEKTQHVYLPPGSCCYLVGFVVSTASLAFGWVCTLKPSPALAEREIYMFFKPGGACTP